MQISDDDLRLAIRTELMVQRISMPIPHFPKKQVARLESPRETSRLGEGTEVVIRQLHRDLDEPSFATIVRRFPLDSNEPEICKVRPPPFGNSFKRNRFSEGIFFSRVRNKFPGL